MTRGRIKLKLRQAARLFDIEPEWLWAIAQIESGFRPDAKNVDSGAAGLFQYLKGTAAEENIDPFDVKEAAAATAKRIRRAKATMEKAGLSPVLMDVYLFHQQGLKGFLEIWECSAGKTDTLSDARIRNMSSNLPATEKARFSDASTHQQKANVFLWFWRRRIERALQEVTA